MPLRTFTRVVSARLFSGGDYAASLAVPADDTMSCVSWKVPALLLSPRPDQTRVRVGRGTASDRRIDPTARFAFRLLCSTKSGDDDSLAARRVPREVTRT